MDAAEAIGPSGGQGEGSPAERASLGAPSFNRHGQRLGRKGRDTRDRILAAATELLAEPGNDPVSLSAVARRASLGMSSLYLYFDDLTELLLALLEPVTAEAEGAFLEHLRGRWAERSLGAECATFVAAFHGHWKKNARLLHMRNTLSDLSDRRLMGHRVESAQRAIRLILKQMDEDPAAIDSPAGAIATVLYTGIERIVSMATNPTLPAVLGRGSLPRTASLVRAEARLLELAVRDGRAAAAARRLSSGRGA